MYVPHKGRQKIKLSSFDLCVAFSLMWGQFPIFRHENAGVHFRARGSRKINN